MEQDYSQKGQTMVIERITDPTTLIQISPYFVAADEATRNKFTQDYFHLMTTSPISCFALIAKEGSEPIAFILAWSHVPQAWVYVAQIWSKAGNDWSIMDKLYTHILLWTIGQGKKSLRGEVIRGHAGFDRRFGFKPIAEVIEYQIPDSQVEGFLEQGRKVLRCPQ